MPRFTAMGGSGRFSRNTRHANVDAPVTALATELKAGLKNLGARATPEDPRLSGGALSVEVPNDKQQNDALYARHGLAGSSSGGLRLCPHLF